MATRPAPPERPKNRAIVTMLLVVLSVLLSSGTAHADADASCAAGWESSVFASARASVVRITDGTGWGAGFVWKTPRHIVTAMHVVARTRSFDILFSDGSKGRAHIVAGDRANDIAILELDGQAPALTPLELGDPASLALGAPVIAIGHPLVGEATDVREQGLRTWTVTRGVLGAQNGHTIQIDAPINHGNSGGPILDCTGRVIGVASYVAGSLGFAVAPRDILAIDADRRIPAISLWPDTARLRVGVTMRFAEFLSYGPFVDFGLIFFDRMHVMVRGTGLLSVASSVDDDRVITSRTGVQLYLGLGVSFRLWRVTLMPHVGGASVLLRENAVTLVNGHAFDTSANRTTTRFTPGLSLGGGRLMFDYRMEINTDDASRSAHLVSASVVF